MSAPLTEEEIAKMADHVASGGWLDTTQVRRLLTERQHHQGRIAELLGVIQDEHATIMRRRGHQRRCICIYCEDAALTSESATRTGTEGRDDAE